MSRFQDIEHRMKQVVDNQVVAAPAFVWDNIEIALDQEKSSRRMWFVWFGGVALVGLLAYASMSIFNVDAIPPSHNSSSILLATDAEDNSKESNNEEVVEAHVANNDAIVNEEEVERKESNQNINVKIVSPPSKVNNRADNTPDVQRSETISSTKVDSKEEVLVAELKEEATAPFVPVRRTAILSHPQDIAHIEPTLAEERVEPVLDNNIECPSFKRSMSLNTFIEGNILYGGHLKTIGNGTDKELASARRDSEKRWYTWGGNVAVGIQINPRFYVAGGLEWAQSKDKFYYEEESLIKMVINFDPNTGAPIDTSFVTGKLLNKGEIRYTSIEVPFFVGYVKNVGTWEMGIEGGLFFNMSFSAEGKVFNSNEEISRIVSEPNIYRSKVGLGMKGGLVFRKYWKNGMSFQLKPTFKLFFDEIQDQNYALPITMKFARFELGVRKEF